MPRAAEAAGPGILAALLPLAVPIDRLEPMPGNPRRGDVDAVARSYERFGQRKPIVARRTGGTARAPRGVVIAGNHQLLAARQLGWKKIAVVWVEDDARTASAFSLADNRTSDLAVYDDSALTALLAELAGDDGLLEAASWGQESVDELLSAIARDGDSVGGGAAGPAPSLSDRFIVPPFSVLDSRQGYWQDRRREWLGLGIRSEEGRGENLLKMSDAVRNGYDWKEQGWAGRKGGAYGPGASGENLITAEAGWAIENGGAWTGTSVFDPVLCEVAYRWFCPPGGRVLDPFGGGSVRGIVAGRLGRRYTGVELAGEQLKANREQLREIGASPKPEWVEGDAREAIAPLSGEFDLLFSCPPYGNLERYSDDPRDLSTMAWPDFCEAYRDIIAKAAAKLAEDRFAVWVVGEVRQKSGDGRYCGLVPETIAAFEAAGLGFYNEAIFVVAVGSLAVRVGRFFSTGRKLGKTHQNVLVFCKGDANRATKACGDVEVDLAAVFGEPLEEGEGDG